MQRNKNLVSYLVRFLGLFGLLFYGTEAIIGLSTPGNHYSPFVAAYLDFITPFRQLLLAATKGLLAIFHYSTYIRDTYTLRLVGGTGVHLAYDCIGYGVISFWIAFVFANPGRWQRKAAWMLGGALLLCAINIMRIALVLLATNKGWPIPLGWDHHTWFNIVAYVLIFWMMYGFDQRTGRGRKRAGGPPKPGTSNAEESGKSSFLQFGN